MRRRIRLFYSSATIRGAWQGLETRFHFRRYRGAVGLRDRAAILFESKESGMLTPS